MELIKFKYSSCLFSVATKNRKDIGEFVLFTAVSF